MFKDLVKKNRSTRGYDESRPVTKEELLEIVDTARLYPSGANLQPVKYAIVYEEKDVKAFREMTGLGGYLPELHLPFPGTAPMGYLVFMGDSNLNKNPQSISMDVGITAQTAALCACDMGHSVCMIGNFKKAEVTEYLGLPENLTPYLLMAVGKGIEEIEIVDPKEGSIRYYRDENGKHYVPKRTLEEVLYTY